ncbi:MAG: hypothetical protein HYT71_02695 [Candidatus Aenigmarchaeota archaeon]|nr:hypothetical protein [Candidatus Aenigmarchaeota archaeon]
MPCHICGSDESNYLCSSCQKEVCYAHARTLNKTLFCVECLKNTKPVKQNTSAFVYSLIVTIGLLVIYLVGEYAIFNVLESYSSLLPDSVKSLVTLFRSSSLLFVAGSALITVLLFLLTLSKDKKSVQPEQQKKPVK